MLYRVIRLLVYPFVRLIFRLKITGKEHIPPNGGFVLCANHTSIADVFILAVVFRRTIHFMGKAELFHSPVSRFLFQKLGSFAVQRGKGDVEAIEQACRYLEKGEVFGIFPEGTRGNGQTLGRGKAGAALIAQKTGAPVLPVSLRYSSGRARAFCRVAVHIGPVLDLNATAEPEETERAKIRRTTGMIMNEITTLWEEKP